MTYNKNSQDAKSPVTASLNSSGQGRAQGAFATQSASGARPAAEQLRPGVTPTNAANGSASRSASGPAKTFSYANGTNTAASTAAAARSQLQTPAKSTGAFSFFNRSSSPADGVKPVASSAAPTASSTSQRAAASISRTLAQAAEGKAAFTPSAFPGASPLALEAQKVAYSRVASSNPDVKVAAQSSLPVQSRIVTDIQYRRFAAYLEEQSGIVLGEGKQYLVNSRLSPLLAKFKVSTVDDLINKAMEPNRYKDISSAVIDAMTTNETLWFRDTYPYLALKNMILPELAVKRKNPVRIWSAACSSGQEPFSIAMVVQEQASQMLHVDPAQTQIVGTDISPEMLERCRLGLYDSHALARGLSTERKVKFFKPTKDPNQMRIDDKIKQMCIFKHMNLLGSYALLGKFDVIFCRNVLIYFNNEVKSQILNKFALSLNPGGYLILGSSESMSGLTDKYDMVRCNPGLAYRLKS